MGVHDLHKHLVETPSPVAGFHPRDPAFADPWGEHWPKLHSVNPVERLNKEVKRRADVVGMFPNEGCIRRLIAAMSFGQKGDWRTASRYRVLDAVAQIDKAAIFPLPACRRSRLSSRRCGHAVSAARCKALPIFSSGNWRSTAPFSNATFGMP